MMPNSRIIPPNNNPNNNSIFRNRSHSATQTMYDNNSSNNNKKGFISRLLANPSSSTSKEYHIHQLQTTSRTKRDSLLGMNNDTTSSYKSKLTISYSDNSIKSSSSISSSNSTTSSGNSSTPSGFGKLFKKKNLVVTSNMIAVEPQDNLPRIRAINKTSAKKKDKSSKIPLAPPPTLYHHRDRTVSQPEHFLNNLPDKYIQKRATISKQQQQLQLQLQQQLQEQEQEQEKQKQIQIQQQQQEQQEQQQQEQQQQQQHVASLNPNPTNTTPISTAVTNASYINRENSTTPINDNSSSLRKSSGSYSIYSTFGGNESLDSVEENTKATNSTQVTTGEGKQQTPPRPQLQSQRQSWQDSAELLYSTPNSSRNEYLKEEEDETINDDDSTDDDDAFVDASGFSQEDLGQESCIEVTGLDLMNLSSGVHYGNADGLMSMDSLEDLSTTTNLMKQGQGLRADDELSKSLLNWKRHSDSSKRWSSALRASQLLQQELDMDEIALPSGSNSGAVGAVDVTDDISADERRASTITVIDLRAERDAVPLTIVIAQEEKKIDPVPLPEKRPHSLLPPPRKVEKRLPAITKPIPPVLSKEEELQNLKKITRADFSKSLDDFWNSDNDNLQLFNDPKTLQLKESIQQSHVAASIRPSRKYIEEEEEKEAAQSLWQESETIVNKEGMAEWLGQGNPFRSRVLYHYMQYFYFGEMKLDSAFRKLCSTLYFKAEAQQIDRILEAFAGRFWECNPDCLFGSSDAVYAVVYSLLLLNTDLHVAQGNHARMTRQEFIRNTMSTVQDQRDHEDRLGLNKRRENVKIWETEMEAYLKEMYGSVKQYQILQPLNPKSSLNKRASILGNKRVTNIKRSVNSIIRKSGHRDSISIDAAAAADLAIAPSSSSSTRLSINVESGFGSRNNRPMSPSIRSPRRSSFSSHTSSTSFSSKCLSPPMTPSIHQNQHPMLSYLNTHSSSLFFSRPPYYKEGVVMRKHLMESTHQKARHREWKECYLEVGNKGELNMYALQSSNNNQLADKSLFRHSSVLHFGTPEASASNNNNNSMSFGGLNYNNNNNNNNSKWTKYSQLTGKISLNHTLSNPLPPPGYNRQRPHVFAIQQSEGGVYLFQTANAEQTLDWVSTCNYWAARESKEPLPGCVGNMEYGWGNCLDDVIMDLDAYQKGLDGKSAYSSEQDPSSIHIHDWMLPTATMVSSQLNEDEQYIQVQKHLKDLNNEINVHRDRKSKILIKFHSKCSNYHKVLTNWEARSKYLLHEIIKYQNYCDSLERSIEETRKRRQGDEIPQLQEDSSKVEHLDLFEEINQQFDLQKKD